MPTTGATSTPPSGTSTLRSTGSSPSISAPTPAEARRRSSASGGSRRDLRRAAPPPPGVRRCRRSRGGQARHHVRGRESGLEIDSVLYHQVTTSSRDGWCGSVLRRLGPGAGGRRRRNHLVPTGSSSARRHVLLIHVVEMVTLSLNQQIAVLSERGVPIDDATLRDLDPAPAHPELSVLVLSRQVPPVAAAAARVERRERRSCLASSSPRTLRLSLRSIRSRCPSARPPRRRRGPDASSRNVTPEDALREILAAGGRR